jgi:MYXO-CTERM domain-containing protein
MKKSALLAAASIAALVCPREAEACGGTFCDSGPQAMPVDQTGENILFVLDGTTVEAHIQIQYQGEAARFAWVIPMPAVPEFSIGSQPLFVNLLNASVPTYGFTNSFCGQQSPVPINGGGGASGSDGTIQTGNGPQVVARETVGAFEIVVLKGGTAQEVSDWLGANGYQDIPSAPAILADYVEQGFVFAALKLTGGSGVDEIHPLVVRYTGNEPCVPLKLTAVAAVENMGVRTFFLGAGRVVPTNYKHVIVNQSRFDWTTFADNYDEVVSRAVDSPVANGRAFVTEYAGPSNVVTRDGVYSESWRAAQFLDLEPAQVVDELVKQGLVSCGGAKCTFTHPLLLPILHQYLPVPAGVDEGAFYSCLGCYAAQIDQTAWDSTQFAVDFQERIVVPGRDASELLDSYPYLTRLYTTISPAEMSEDPIFHERADLPAVGAQSIANRMTAGPMAFELPDGRTVALTEQGAWPELDPKLPWAERVEEIPASGDPIVLVDNASLIDLILEDHNLTSGWTDDLCDQGAGGGAAASGSGGTAGIGGLGGASGSGGRAGAAASSANADDATAAGGGCGCSVPGDRRHASWLLGVGGLLLLLRRARRQPSPARPR